MSGATTTRRRLDGLSAAGLLLPTLLVLALVIGYPLLLAVNLSLFSDPIAGVPEFVGADNYARALWGADAGRFWSAAATTGGFTLVVVALELAVGLAMALFMNQLKRGKAFARVCVLVPWAVPTAVATVLWQWMFSTGGVVNALTGTETLWTGAEGPARAAVVIIDVWKTAPFVALLLLAGLQTIPGETYEAAKVDGAGAWKRFTRVTLPMLAPATAVAVLFRILDALRMYDVPAILTNGANGTTTLSLLTQQLAIGQVRVGYGSALSTLTFLLIFLVALAFIRATGARIAGGRS
ncbi:sugar ABC transporter permease [Dactylosporangium sp. AC04546]|uniref:carbohydrate ABC transporter permease n=1 Tax=Dactylosporangium sp. AC04546 TaxID=2862460 RepID=UPI001EDF861C|nr:sugar ABC transporter permease [Dactylosporangium sp. AC04546]WVK81188.1 sugar ABC transporter permease [Dactylosporangium sp. AC04546]